MCEMGAELNVKAVGIHFVDSALPGLYQNGKDIFDVSFKVKHGHFVRAHKIVLASASQWFEKAFTADPSRISELQQFDVLAINDVIDHIYTGVFHLHVAVFMDVVKLAHMLQLNCLFQQCSNIIRKKLCGKNVSKIWSFANCESIPELLKICQVFVLENFEELSKENAFYIALGRTDFINILKHDDLAVYNEETIFRAITKWAEINGPQDVMEMFDHLRVVYLSEEFKTNILTPHPFYKSFLEARSNACPENVRKRKYISEPILKMVLLKNINESIKREVYIFDKMTASWEKRAPIIARHRAEVVGVNGKLISTGSFKKSNEVHILDVATGKWTEGCNRPANNSFVSVCCVFGKLLVCGGGGRQFHLYDPEADTWKIAEVEKPSPCPCGYTILHVEKKYLLFLGGGFQIFHCTRNAFYLDIDEHPFFTSDSTDAIKLSPMPPLLQRSQTPFSTYVDRRILLSHDKTYELFVPTSMDPWSPKEGQWSFIKFIPNSDSQYVPNVIAIAHDLYSISDGTHHFVHCKKKEEDCDDPLGINEGPFTFDVDDLADWRFEKICDLASHTITTITML